MDKRQELKRLLTQKLMRREMLKEEQKKLTAEANELRLELKKLDNPNVGKGHGHTWTNEEYVDILNLRAEGLRFREIGERIGKPDHYANRIYNQGLNKAAFDLYYDGELPVGFGKLTPAAREAVEKKAREIEALSSTGPTYYLPKDKLVWPKP